MRRVDKLTIIGSRLVAWTAPNHCLNQCWNIVNWTLRNKFQWNFNRNSNISIQENALESVVDLSPACIQNRHHNPANCHLCYMNIQSIISYWMKMPMKTLYTSLALCEGKPPVFGGFPSQMTSNTMWSLNVSFFIGLNKLLTKQLSCQWFDAP